MTLPTSHGPDVAVYADPDALNSDLSERLKACALICELALDEPMHHRLIAAMGELRRRGVTHNKTSLRRYAALVATYLVAEGVFSYEKGAFWPNLSVADIDRSALVDAFEHALMLYGTLEQFRPLVDAGAHPYLAPILAHGGIPKSSLRDFFHVVIDAERRGAGDAPEMLAYWREHPSAFANIDRPVKRFLLFGGDVSLDFLDRCLDLVRADLAVVADLPLDYFGLPPYVCEAFLKLEPTERRHGGSASGRVSTLGVARPYALIDPWNTAGPMLVLPRLAGSLRDSAWDIVAQGHAARFPGSWSEREVPLTPARYWNVELRDSAGNSIRTFAFSGLARTGALFFDYEDCRLVNDLTRLRSTRLWVLWPGGDAEQLRQANGTVLQPIEVAPRLTGAWDGYQIAAYDLAGIDRIHVEGPSSNGANPDESSSALWVRVRSDRIALGGVPIAGVTIEEGLVVYGETPTLVLPGFNASEATQWAGRSPWFARVTCNGVEHVFDAAALGPLGGELIRSVVPAGGIARVQVTARGPLGMDLRCSFCVIPGLRVERPTAVLLPARQLDQIVGTVIITDPIGGARRVDVRSGNDYVTTNICDGYGIAAEIHITVPCLQWAIVAGDESRAPLSQQQVRASSHDVLNQRVALLVVRTHRPGVWLTLQLSDGKRVLGTLVHSTAGDDGRWAFDLRAFSDTVRASAEPLLRLLLNVDGFPAVVGSIRAELDIADLRVRQRLVPGAATVTLTWREERPLRHRVARLWPLTTPWAPPIVAEIPDNASGEATVSGSEDAIPPGCYLAEVAVDDGWTTVRRPRFSVPTSREFRLGTEEDEERWLGQRAAEGDPFALLAIVCAGGRVSRSFDANEVDGVTPAALEALWMAREQGVPVAPLAAVARLITVVPDAFVRGVEAAAINWDHDRPLLQAVLDVFPALPQSAFMTRPVEDTSTLWELCPALAAAIDLPHSAIVKVRARCEEGLGASLDDAKARPLVPNTRGPIPELQIYATMPMEQLDSIRRASSLLPRRVLDLDNQAAVQLEWLIADRRGDFVAPEWSAAYRFLADNISGLPSHLRAQFTDVCAPADLQSKFPAIRFPETVIAVALHTVVGSPYAQRAVGALRELIPLCPGIVTRSLVLAAVHAYLEA